MEVAEAVQYYSKSTGGQDPTGRTLPGWCGELYYDVVVVTERSERTIRFCLSRLPRWPWWRETADCWLLLLLLLWLMLALSWNLELLNVLIKHNCWQETKIVWCSGIQAEPMEDHVQSSLSFSPPLVIIIASMFLSNIFSFILKTDCRPT